MMYLIGVWWHATSASYFSVHVIVLC